MKARTVNLVLMGLCLGLLGVVGRLAYLVRHNPARVQYVTEREVLTNPVITVRKINATNVLFSLLKRARSWSDLESTNYVLYIQNLLAFGCPEETVRDIIIADISNLYAGKKAALKAQLPAPRYWQSPRTRARQSPELAGVQAQLRALDAEQRTLVKDLLGVDLDAELARYAGDDRAPDVTLDFLSPEKRHEVQSVLERYPADDPSGSPDAAEARLREQERDAELAGLLTPEELFEFQVRHSALTKSLQQRLESFEPTEEEFREVFQLQRELDRTLDQRFDEDDLRNHDIRSKVLAGAQAAYAEELKAKLGQSRYTEYVRSQDADYQALLRLSERFDLPKTKVASVYDLKQTAQQHREAIAADTSLTETQRQAAYDKIARETQNEMASLLGQDMYAAYRDTSPAWIHQRPPPQPEPPEPVVIEVPVPVLPSPFPPLPDGFPTPPH
ncbi:MAG: hypothetical protein JXQ71_11430 [Verrucomicrobia bacterium]|nr:hypothetical protein [Verrucomicrobiota bacterium]